jgi:hypothetical protein
MHTQPFHLSTIALPHLANVFEGPLYPSHKEPATIQNFDSKTNFVLLGLITSTALL